MKSIYLIALASLISLVSFAQPTLGKNNQLSQGAANKEGMSAERLGLIASMLKEEVELNNIPGAVALIIRNGKIIFHEAYGTANEKGDLLEKNDIFRIASQTKAITSTAVMMLWEKGLFRLDDPISKYIPEFKNPQVLDRFTYSDTSYTTTDANREITIRDLLSHQSGLGYGVIDGDERMKMLYEKADVVDLFSTEKVTIKDIVMKLAKLPLHHNPGEGYTYSLGLDVLGYFVEVISGQPFDVFLRENIFNPLEMNDTRFYLEKNQEDRLVSIQRKVNDKWEDYPSTFYEPDYPIKGARTFFSGGAGLSSTALDYAKFLQMYLNNGYYNGERILSRTTIESMMQNQIKDFWEGNGKHYGLAFGVVDAYGVAKGGNGAKGTFDWGGYFNTQYFADPREGIIGVLMKQTQGWTGDQSGWKFRQMVFAAVND